MAMAPPLTLSRSSGMLLALAQHLAGEGFVQLYRPMSSMLRPKRCKSLGTASTGPMPISSGGAAAGNGHAAINTECLYAAAARFIGFHHDGALAPSESCEALPAVTHSPCRSCWPS